MVLLKKHTFICLLIYFIYLLFIYLFIKKERKERGKGGREEGRKKEIA